ncbi:MAG: type I-E CRISPR-associated endoribonuclease Cas2 [Deltaproteobacteria bacterium]|nr:type I-E CRISPR-associated endoribonuclease Cas2 [Deltaproteobacteria bacterium]MBW1987522.1 type I-E CRISPR-associated endoribonuclease Cas2 [Deltaproteobacteria bacterium]
MVVLILERVPPGLRGEITRWLLEPKAGVFVGSVSGMVRERLWAKVTKESRGGGCLMIHTSNKEQGFAVKIWGDPSRTVEDFEGLSLIRVP